MGLEAATYIHQLDPTNPVGGADPKSQGDDHIRLTKQTLQNTLPNVEGEVTASHTELNALTGVTPSDINLIKTGVHTPTVFNQSAGVSSVTPQEAMWTRIGNVVTVTGTFTFIATTSAAHSFEFSLPVASDFTQTHHLAGVAQPSQAGAINAGFIAQTANNRALFGAAVAASTYSMSYTFSYRVL